MEEENLCSTSPDVTGSDLQQPHQDSWTSIDHQYVYGEQQTSVWSETEVQINQPHGTDELTMAGGESPEEAEQWEQVIWPVRPMTCTSPLLSFATVQWDMPDVPDPAAETSSLMTDTIFANELDSDSVTSLDATSLPPPPPLQSEDAERFTPEVGEEEEGFDFQLLNSNLETTGSAVEPCDAADVQELTAQEKEESTHGLLLGSNEDLVRTDSAEDEGRSATPDPVETVDFLVDILEEASDDDEEDSFVNLKLEEEQEGPAVLLTGQGDAEEEKSSQSGAEAEEENEEGGEVEEEEHSVACAEESEEAETASCDVLCQEVSAEPLATDSTGPNLNPDQLIDQPECLGASQHSGSEEDLEILEQLREDPTGQSGELEMILKDVDQSLEPQQSGSTENAEEPATNEADDGERNDDSQEMEEPTEHLEETRCQDCDQEASQDSSQQPELSESEQLEVTKELEEIQAEVSRQEEERQAEECPVQGEESAQPEDASAPDEPPPSEQAACVEAEGIGAAERRQQQTEPSEQREQTTSGERLTGPEETDEAERTEQLFAEAEVTQPTAEFNQVDKQAEAERRCGGGEGGAAQTVVANGEQRKPPDSAVHVMNGGQVDREAARRLAERLFKLDGIQRVDVVKHLDKDNDFSRAVGEEYLKFFDFTGQTLDHALRSFLKVVVLIGETQERERVLQCFASRYHQCNPDAFSCPGAVLALTCALMLLNTDLHGQNVGKSMSSAKFVSNLDEMNEGENFSKDLLKSLYNSIKSEHLEWAVDEEELKNTVLVDEDAADDAPLRSKANPFQDVPHDKKARVVKEGFLQRKLHADIDGKRTPWGKRSWKTFYGVLRGMVLYLQKNDRRDQPTNEEVVSVHHSVAEQAADYTKKPHVFRLQTADWRVFLFQASSKVEMNLWISRINLVSALHSSPPFPAAVGSQRRFFRPILPASQSAHTLEHQLKCHSGMLESFKADLSHLQENLPEGKKGKAKELEEQRVRAEYLRHEVNRYEIYIQVLEAWKSVKKTDDNVLSAAALNLFDKEMFANSVGKDDEEDGLKKSHSSPSLELEMPPPTMIKVRRNISERRTYRRTIIPRWNKEA